MVHERDEKYEGHEDGEYHFSDDQANYEMESDVVEQPAAAPKPTKAVSAQELLQQYKRPLIGVAVFVFLIFLVYKISAPSVTPPASDFAPNAGITPPPQVKKPALQAAAGAQNSAFQPLAQPLGMSSASSTAAPQVAPPTSVPAPPAPAMPAAQPPVVASAPSASPAATVVAQTSAMPVQQETAVAQSQPAPAVVIQPEAPAEPIYNPVHPTESRSSIVLEPSELAGVNQKLATVTQQNAKLQTEYKQKLSDYEEQNSELQNKVQALNARIAGLETTLAHIDQSMQSARAAATREATAVVQVPAQGAEARPVEPRVSYMVQAIIPGRAWLKSESGETVTVAEGDTLKGYGRIMKIDPYDGLVELDVGGKIVSLSYGASSE